MADKPAETDKTKMRLARDKRLAAALRENLKRRKSPAPAEAGEPARKPPTK